MGGHVARPVHALTRIVISSTQRARISDRGDFLGIIGWDLSVCKSNRLGVDTLGFFYINLRYIPQIPLKWAIILLKSRTSTGYFSYSTASSVTNCRFSPIIGPKTHFPILSTCTMIILKKNPVEANTNHRYHSERSVLHVVMRPVLSGHPTLLHLVYDPDCGPPCTDTLKQNLYRWCITFLFKRTTICTDVRITTISIHRKETRFRADMCVEIPTKRVH